MKILEVVFGALMLVPRIRPLALVLIAHIVVNIFLYEVFIARALSIGVLLVILNVIALYQHRDAYRGMVRARN